MLLNAGSMQRLTVNVRDRHLFVFQLLVLCSKKRRILIITCTVYMRISYIFDASCILICIYQIVIKGIPQEKKTKNKILLFIE